MKTKEILLQLIEELDKFEHSLSENETPDMNDFIAFLCNTKNIEQRYSSEVEIAQHVSLLHRYSKFYMKKVLKNSAMKTMEEYTYLIPLLHRESLSKTELNSMNVMEKTSGNEIIKRLLKKNLIRQQRNQLDRRSMSVFITDKGRNEILKLYPNLQKSATLLSSSLSTSQKTILANSMREMSHFHSDIFINGKDKTIDEIMQELT
ncbi:MAG: MarR family winged helix-turn-helix transcriptional regulator [Dysgonamonadaceae bacterium]|nr:MarR family winged helix-turn-helix transcriptional regulator [Dysgonamonadaceae bacterium]MDD4727128.1 MarR family winged helix-turn-helix transcriptional regulator [Dysgonamonadaceae bacterium]